MKTLIFNGKELAQEKEEKLKAEIERRKLQPKLVVVLVGDNPASQVFVRLKKEAAARTGIDFELKKFSAKAASAAVIAFIQEKNKEEETTGIMIQLPLPKKFDELKIRRAIRPFKDVDCLHPENLGRLMMARPLYLPAFKRND